MELEWHRLAGPLLPALTPDPRGSKADRRPPHAPDHNELDFDAVEMGKARAENASKWKQARACVLQGSLLQGRKKRSYQLICWYLTVNIANAYNGWEKATGYSVCYVALIA